MATQVTKLYLGETLGAILLGNIVAAIFYGITNMQTYIYYVRNRGDPLALKSLVFILWLLDSVHLAFITHTVYTYTITDFGDPLAITKPIWSVIVSYFTCSVGLFTESEAGPSSCDCQPKFHDSNTSD
ncbi:hypothetical protein AcW1_006162 [Taiwanofungus camphoratus]|nr:hypothetical protein AcW1_006162 [Antrodia cinnamomea]